MADDLPPREKIIRASAGQRNMVILLVILILIGAGYVAASFYVLPVNKDIDTSDPTVVYSFQVYNVYLKVPTQVSVSTHLNCNVIALIGMDDYQSVIDAKGLTSSERTQQIENMAMTYTMNSNEFEFTADLGNGEYIIYLEHSSGNVNVRIRSTERYMTPFLPFFLALLGLIAVLCIIRIVILGVRKKRFGKDIHESMARETREALIKVRGKRGIQPDTSSSGPSNGGWGAPAGDPYSQGTAAYDPTASSTGQWGQVSSAPLASPATPSIYSMPTSGSEQFFRDPVTAPVYSASEPDPSHNIYQRSPEVSMDTSSIYEMPSEDPLPRDTTSSPIYEFPDETMSFDEPARPEKKQTAHSYKGKKGARKKDSSGGKKERGEEATKNSDNDWNLGISVDDDEDDDIGYLDMDELLD